MPNFDKISQSTVEVKLYDFDVCVVIGVSFYICFPNFVVIGRSSAELRRHIEFLRWRPESEIYFRIGV